MAMTAVVTNAFRRVAASSAAVPSSLFTRAMSSDGTKKTALYDLHVELGGKMVPFGGYQMPVQYKDGILKSHLHTREPGCSSLFDVSHMGQVKVTGADRVRFMEHITVGDIESLEEGQARLSLITNEKGGIIDDTVITNYGDHLSVVLNAGNKYIDLEHIHKQLETFKGDVHFDHLTDKSLIALQGPGAAATLQSFVDIDVAKLAFMSGVYAKVNGIDCIITRCGYTGEDGFEISAHDSDIVDLTRAFLNEETVLEAGLGARDSLRLEAGLCLHGHDINDTTTPVEAALMWTMGKRRREEANFIGAEPILKQFTEKSATKKRVGFVVASGAPAREGAVIFDTEGVNQVGVVTSGTMSPCLNRAIGMGYINKGYFKIGSNLKVAGKRGKMQDITVTKMPFIESNYYRIA